MTIEDIVEAVKKMDAVQLNDLAKAIQEAFGIEGAMAMPMMGPAMAAGAAPAAAEVEQTAFSVILQSAGDRKVQVIKVVKEILGGKLAEAKEVVDKAPVPIREGIPEQEANRIKEQLEEAGASVEIK